MRREPLEDLLTRSRAAVAEGDFTALDSLVPQIEARLAALPGLSPGALHRLHHAAGEAALLAKAALEGVQAARRRQSAAEGTTTYQPDGRRTALPPAGKGGIRRL